MGRNAGERAGIDWDAEPRLGVLSDRRLARVLGVSQPTVSAARKARGLAAPHARPRRGVDWDELPLGECSDATLARQLGCARSTVREARVRRGRGAYTGDAGRQMELFG